MTLFTSRVVSSCENSGFSEPGEPTSASTAVPPRAAFGTVAIGWHPTAARIATAAQMLATRSRARLGVRKMLLDPEVGDREDQEGDHHVPRGPVNLALQATP